MRKDNTIEAFFALIRAGLWGEADANLNLNANDNLFEGVEWEKIYQLAQEQAVLGLVLAGLEQYKNLNVNLDVNQMWLLQSIGEVRLIEQRNKSMNVYFFFGIIISPPLKYRQSFSTPHLTIWSWLGTTRPNHVRVNR